MATDLHERIQLLVAWRRRRVALLVAVAAMVAAPVILFATSAGASRAAYHVTLPDLQILVPTDNISIGNNPDTGDRQLQFTHITWDAGTGPFQIKPKYSRRTGTANFVQTIYKSRNGSSWRPAYTVPLAATGVFDPPSDYRYPLTRFTVNTVNGAGSLGPVVATSPKSDYCITADAFVGGVPNAPNNTSPPQSNCTKPNKPLGLSVGWGDEYDQTDNGQPIDLTGVPDGTYILQAQVDPDHLFAESDPNNNVVDTELQISGNTVEVIDQTNPFTPLPAVALSSPAEGSRVSGTVTLSAPAKAKSPVTVKSVQFLLDGQPLGSPATSAPYTYSWTVGSTSPGSHALSARATDSDGHVVTAPVKMVNVVNSAPVYLVRSSDPAPKVALINPVSTQTVSGTIPVAASAHDNVAVRSVQFLMDGRPLGIAVSVAPYAVHWNTKTVADGLHTLSVVSTNANGVKGTATDVTVTVANPAPPMTCFVLQVHGGSRGRRTVTSPSFHTAAAGETLLAFVSADGPPGAGKQTAAVRGAGLTWKLLKRANAGLGDAEIWAATAPTILAGATVSSTLARPGYDQHLTVIAMEGIDGVGASSAASGAGGPPNLSLRTSSPTSLVFAVGDASGAVVRTLPTGWVPLGQWVDRAGHSTYWGQYTNQPTGGAGTVVKVMATAPAGGRWNMAAVELAGDGN
jgi:hypothetical protein